MRNASQVSCETALYLNLSDGFLMITLGLSVWWKKATEINMLFSSHHIKGTYYLHDLWLLKLTLNTWCWGVFVMFFLYEVVSIFPFSDCTLWKEVIRHTKWKFSFYFLIHILFKVLFYLLWSKANRSSDNDYLVLLKISDRRLNSPSLNTDIVFNY